MLFEIVMVLVRMILMFFFSAMSRLASHEILLELVFLMLTCCS